MARSETVILTRAELSAVLEAISQMTDGNARDFSSWREQTCGNRREWANLLSGEGKLQSAQDKLTSRYLSAPSHTKENRK